MLIYQCPARGWARALRLLGALVFVLASLPKLQAQERRYLFEVGGGGGYQSFADTTHLDNAAGGIGRIGVWLPLNFSIEAEGSIASANSVGVKTGSISALYNLPVGSRTWVHAKLGFGGTRYGASGTACLTDTKFVGKTCGTTTTLVTGAGVRIGLTPMLLLRAEGVLYPNRGTTLEGTPPDTVRKKVRFSNFGINLGVSVMLGSKPIPDSDGDGVLNNRDRCPNTPPGAQVDGSGCPADNDGDGVVNGVDRCPNTPTGALVDAAGCPRDSDGDNIADGIDKCPNTPAGVLVDANGCPKDSDADGIPDGLDRCSATPKGATVDALGCPGDEDADGVLDGLDRCPRTPIGVTVNASGCAAGQQRQPAAAPAQPIPQPPPPPSPQPADTSPPTQARVERAPPRAPNPPTVLEGVTFESGSARLQSGSYVELDSLAKVLMANKTLRIEIGGHTDDSGTPSDNQHLSTLRAEAVRNYLLAKGVPFQQMVARGYGSTVPRTPDTTPRGRAANRRVEVKPIPPGE